jgi:virulence factor Mce-like protein
MSDAADPSKGTGLRKRFEQRPGEYRPKTLRNGAIFLFVIVVALYSGYTKHIPLLPSGGTDVKAVFDRAAQIRARDTLVRSHGVPVGKVKKVELNPDGPGVLVTMHIDKGQHLELRRDARAAIWWRTLLGWNMYVDIDPGSPSAPPMAGDTIPLAHTQTQQEFDELLRPLDASGRQGLRTTIRAFDEGFADRSAVGGTVRSLSPAMRAVAPGVRALRGDRPGDLPGLVRGTSRALRALSASQSDLAGLIDSAAVTLGVTAARRADVGRTLDLAPAAMADTRATMTRLRATLDTLDPVARKLTPGARELDGAARALNPALDQLVPLLADAEPTLRDLRPSLARLGAVGRSGAPLIDATTPTLDRANKDILPWLAQRDPDIGLRTYEAIGPFFSALGSMSSPFEANGHMLNFQPAPDERALHGTCLTFFTDPSAKDKVNCSALTQTLGSLLGGTPSRTRKGR